MAEAAFNKNGDGSENKPISPDTMRILVVGENRCGKTSFINTFAKDNFSEQPHTQNASGIYPYSCYNNYECRKYAFIEIPGVKGGDIPPVAIHHLSAKGCILMFAIDDPSSLQQLRDKWIPQLNYFINDRRIPTIAVGYKTDLREDPRVIQRLELTGLAPVTEEEGRSLTENSPIQKYFDCSQKDPLTVNDACNFILAKAYEYVQGAGH